MIISDAEKLFISPSYEEVDLFPFPGVKQYFYSGLQKLIEIRTCNIKMRWHIIPVAMQRMSNAAVFMQ